MAKSLLDVNHPPITNTLFTNWATAGAEMGKSVFALDPHLELRPSTWVAAVLKVIPRLWMIIEQRLPPPTVLRMVLIRFVP
jgi:hypothetical protein